MVDAMLFMLPSVNDDIHRLLKERRLAEALDVSSRRLQPRRRCESSNLLRLQGCCTLRVYLCYLHRC